MHLRISLVLLALVSAYSFVADALEPAHGPPSTCPVTLPSDSSFVPPPPYRKETGRFWLGTRALWTSLADDGIWRGIVSANGVRNKFWWWREGWQPDDSLADGPQLSVNARRLDKLVAPIREPEPTNALVGGQWMMLVMLEIPTSGCWEITGSYAAEYVSMIVWVPPSAALKE